MKRQRESVCDRERGEIGAQRDVEKNRKRDRELERKIDRESGRPRVGYTKSREDRETERREVDRRQYNTFKDITF